MDCFNGLRIMEDMSMVDQSIEKNPSYKWWHEIYNWNPCNSEFRIPRSLVVTTPKKEFYTMNGMIIGHPEVIAKLKAEISRRH